MHPVLPVSQLPRKRIQSCLSGTFYDGSHLENDDLKEALAKHAEFCQGYIFDPASTAAAVTRMLAVGAKPTTVERVKVVVGNLESELENTSAAAVYRDTNGLYMNRPTHEVTMALVAIL